MPIKITPPENNKVTLKANNYLVVQAFRDLNGFDNDKNAVRISRLRAKKLKYTSLLPISLAPNVSKKKTLKGYLLTIKDNRFDYCEEYSRKEKYRITVDCHSFDFLLKREEYFSFLLIENNEKNYERIKEKVFYSKILVENDIQNPKVACKSHYLIKKEEEKATQKRLNNRASNQKKREKLPKRIALEPNKPTKYLNSFNRFNRFRLLNLALILSPLIVSFAIWLFS